MGIARALVAITLLAAGATALGQTPRLSPAAEPPDLYQRPPDPSNEIISLAMQPLIDHSGDQPMPTSYSDRPTGGGYGGAPSGGGSLFDPNSPAVIPINDDRGYGADATPPNTPGGVAASPPEYHPPFSSGPNMGGSPTQNNNAAPNTTPNESSDGNEPDQTDDGGQDPDDQDNVDGASGSAVFWLLVALLASIGAAIYALYLWGMLKFRLSQALNEKAELESELYRLRREKSSR